MKCFIADHLVQKSKDLFLIKQHFPNQKIFTICETRRFTIVSTGAGRLSLPRDCGSSPIFPNLFNLNFSLPPHLRLRISRALLLLELPSKFLTACFLTAVYKIYSRLCTNVQKLCLSMVSFYLKKVNSTVRYRDAPSEITHLRPLYEYSNVK
jgi:hypothetical protein